MVSLTKAGESAKIPSMDTHLTDGISLRLASLMDAKMIRKMIHDEKLNPMGLNWEHFTIAVDQAGNVIGCGQIKPHTDGSYELASIAILPEWRGMGVARRIIEHLLEKHPGRLYLTCRSTLAPMYEKFGFQAIQEEEFTPYFRRLSRIVTFVSKLVRLPDRMFVMRRG